MFRNIYCCKGVLSLLIQCIPFVSLQYDQIDAVLYSFAPFVAMALMNIAIIYKMCQSRKQQQKVFSESSQSSTAVHVNTGKNVPFKNISIMKTNECLTFRESEGRTPPRNCDLELDPCDLGLRPLFLIADFTFSTFQWRIFKGAPPSSVTKPAF